jgi:copper chaperone CopZ
MRKLCFTLACLSSAFVLALPAHAGKAAEVIEVGGWESAQEAEDTARVIEKECEGIELVVASFETSTVTVTFDDTLTSLEKIKDAIRRAGFKVAP